MIINTETRNYMYDYLIKNDERLRVRFPRERFGSMLDTIDEMNRLEEHITMHQGYLLSQWKVPNVLAEFVEPCKVSFKDGDQFLDLRDLDALSIGHNLFEGIRIADADYVDTFDVAAPLNFNDFTIACRELADVIHDRAMLTKDLGELRKAVTLKDVYDNCSFDGMVVRSCDDCIPYELTIQVYATDMYRIPIKDIIEGRWRELVKQWSYKSAAKIN